MPKTGGALKAYRAMTKRYGKTKGTHVFYATANKYSRRGKTAHARTQFYYRTGGHQHKRAKVRR